MPEQKLRKFCREKLENNWGINVVGKTGYQGDNDIEFGSLNDIATMRIGETLVNPGNISNDSPLSTMSKISDFLYEITYKDINYDYAIKNIDKPNSGIAGMCTSIRNGNLFGRNFDWFYNNQVNFVIHTIRSDDHYASVGVTGADSVLTKDFVESKRYSEAYEILPFYTVDGINECGVVCSCNIVPLQKNKTTGTIPTEEKELSISMICLPRWILDRYSSALDAVDDITKHISVYANDNLWSRDCEIHLMIADKDKTFLMEFINNKTVITDMTAGANSAFAGKPYMTNFYLSDVSLNNDGTVYTPQTQTIIDNAMVTNNITSLGSGLERYNIVAENYSASSDYEGMSGLLLNQLKATNAYRSSQNPYWYTEFVGIGDLTVISDPYDFRDVVSQARYLFDHRDRNRGNETWCTTHTSIYDIENRTLCVYSQEEDVQFVFGTENTQSTLPRVSTLDDGSTLIVENGKWTKGYGSSLPPVTQEDNGKFLGVSDGKWKTVNIGRIFRIKGTKETYNDLPKTGNEVGDVWYVKSESVGYIWIDDGDGERWEQIGSTIDLSEYAKKQDVDSAIASAKIEIMADVSTIYQPLEPGKGLSTNDFTNEYKQRVDNAGTVQSVSAGVGLKIDGVATINPRIEFDDETTFNLKCGDGSNTTD